MKNESRSETLPNGLTVLLLIRPQAPVFSFFTIVDAGDAQDPAGKTGLAHMMEHMAFKGTDNIGTTNFAAEKEALAKVEAAYAAYDRENNRAVNRDEKKVAELKAAWEKAREDADQYVVKNEFGEIIERNGGVGLNASTGLDSTEYFYSLPANRLELWAFLESDRFLHPVMREFYKERDVVMEERRMRTDSSPTGRLVEQFLSVAYDGSPYHRPGIGYTSDLRHFSATDAANFFKTYYVPSNMVVAVVGDLDAEKTFAIGGKILRTHSLRSQAGRVRHGADPAEFRTQGGAAGSLAAFLPRGLSEAGLPRQGRCGVFGHQRRDERRPHLAAVSLAGARQENCGGRGGLQRISRRQVPQSLRVLCGALARTQRHRDGQRNPRSHRQAEDRRREPDELKMVKTRSKAALLRSLANNQGLAINLAENQLKYGDWRELFRRIDKIDAVTNEDVKRVANEVFVDTNRTVGILETGMRGKGEQR